MKYVFNFKQLSICTWRLINTCACVKFLQVLQIVHRYLWTTLTYLQNICKLFTDILQIRENLLEIIAVLSQICYRYWQIFNIYVSLVRDMSKKGHSLDLSFTMAYYCQYCVARVKCVTPHVTCSLFLKLHMFKLFPHERLQIKFPLCFTAFFCNLFLSHFLMNTWSSTCPTADMCNRKIHGCVTNIPTGLQSCLVTE